MELVRIADSEQSVLPQTAEKQLQRLIRSFVDPFTFMRICEEWTGWPQQKVLS